MGELSRKPMGVDTSDATATAANIESGYTAYVNGVKLTGAHTPYIANILTASTYTITLSASKSYALFAYGCDEYSTYFVAVARLINGVLAELADANNQANWSFSSGTLSVHFGMGGQTFTIYALEIK